jgi:hypothetical protein
MKEDIVEKLLEYLQNTQDFVLEQVPQVIQQALRYEKISAYMVAIIMSALLLAAAIIFCYFWKNPSLDVHGCRKISSVMGMYIPGAISAIVFIQLCVSIDRLIEIYIAPKYFLIQLFMNMKN